MEIPISEDIKQYRKDAKEYGLSVRGEYINEDTRQRVIVITGSIKEVISHQSGEEGHLASVAAIPQIIEKSIFIEEFENEDKRKHSNIDRYQYFVSGIRIDNNEYVAKAVVAVDKDGAGYYNHRLTHIEKNKLIDAVQKKKSCILTTLTE